MTAHPLKKPAGHQKISGHHRPVAKSQIESAANDFLADGKKLANALYENSKEKFNLAEDQIKGYSDDLLKKVQKNPLASILIAGGIGFILSALWKK